MGCRVEFLKSNYGLDNVLVNRSSSQCACRDGDDAGSPEPFFPWQAADWVSAQYLPLTWVEDTHLQTSKLQVATDILRLEQSFSYALQSWNFFWTLSSVNCQTFPLLNSINDFLCTCLNPDIQLCEPDQIPQIVAVTITCPGEERVWNLGQAQFFLAANSFSGDFCVTIVVEQSLSSEFLIVKKKPISTSFVYKHSYKSSEIVANENDRIIGTVLSSSGFTFEFSDPQQINFFNICILAQEDSRLTDPEVVDKYPVWTIAVGDGSRLKQHHAQVWLETNQQNQTSVCLNFTQSLFPADPSRVDFFLAKVSESWEDSDSLSSSEFILLVLASCIYWTLCLLSLFITLSSISFWEPMIAKGEYSFFFGSGEVFCFAFFRGLLFALLASMTSMTSAGENILIELPTFLYLSLVIDQISTFRPEASKQRKNLFSLIMNTLLLIAFIIVIILLDVIKNDDPSTSCRGRVVDDTSSLSNSDKLRIIYKTVIGFLSLLAALFLAYSGFKALVQMRDFRVKNQQVLQGLEAYELPVIIKTTVVSVALALNCLGFILYYSLDTPSPYFVLFLFATEVVPLLILITTFRREIGLKYGSSRHGTSTGPSTVDL